MIYELRIYDAEPGTAAAAEQHLAAACAERGQDGALLAAWRTEIGPLNRFIHVYASKSTERRDAEPMKRCTRAPGRDGIVCAETRLMAPLSFSPPAEELSAPYYEIRSYVYREGDLPEIERSWGARIGERVKTSPVYGVWRSVDTGPNTIMHIWPYRSLDERADIRRRVGGWSRAVAPNGEPRGAYRFVRQETTIAVPTSYSPGRHAS